MNFEFTYQDSIAHAPEDTTRLVVVIPALNEEEYIERCIHSLLPQLSCNGKIVVVDGGSVDQTRCLVEQIARLEGRVELVENPRRLQAAAVNLVARHAATETNLLIRADAHALYPPNFIKNVLASYRRAGAQSVVVPMRTIGTSCFQRAVAAAQNSILGNGGALHRNSGASGYIEHGHHALFHLPAFQLIGGYDETFAYNEDAEFDYRLTKAGGKIWLCAETVANYFPRSTPWELAKQYFRHGQGRGKMLLKHKARPRLRQLLPIVALVVCIFGAAGSLLSPAALLAPLVYLLGAASWGCCVGLLRRDRCAAASGFAAVIMHLSWALGLLMAFLTCSGSRSKGDTSRDAAPTLKTILSQ
jgi:succinoglycan biosynthesis protein ExoA